jgi:predicted outer membrane protein
VKQQVAISVVEYFSHGSNIKNNYIFPPKRDTLGVAYVLQISAIAVKIFLTFKQLHMRTVLLFSIALPLFTACNHAVISSKSTNTSNTTDHNLVSVAFQSSLYAMKIAEEGSLRSASFETKRLAEKSLYNHKAILAMLQEFAQTKGITLPVNVNVQEAKQWKDMVAQKGSLFDRSFIELADKQNNYVLEVFDNMSKRAKDADIRRTAKNILAYANDVQDISSEKQAGIANKSSSSPTIKTASFIPQ